MISEDTKLTLKQEEFCRLYASSEEFFANGVQSYSTAYGQEITDKKSYDVCASGAYENLRKPQISARIDELLELRGLNDSYVDKQLELLITQKVDFKSKLGAIKEYNALRSRVTVLSKSEVVAEVTTKAEKSDVDAMMAVVKQQTANAADE
jgi:hypothetical protein